MKKLQSPFVRTVLAIVLALAVLAGSVRVVAASNGAVTWKNVTDTIQGFGTCSDPNGLYQITIVSSGAVHYVQSENGYEFSWAENGTSDLTPIDADSTLTYSGRYAIQVQDHLNPGNSIFTYNFVDTTLGSDGTREVFKVTYHLVITSDGVEREVDNFQWICN